MNSERKIIVRIANDIDGPSKSASHPIEDLKNYLAEADPKTVPHTSQVNDDGSVKITVTMPSRSEMEKQRAMKVVEEQMRQQQGQPQPPQQQNQPVAARSNVKVKIASAQNKMVVTKKFPNSFIRAMGLE